MELAVALLEADVPLPLAPLPPALPLPLSSAPGVLEVMSIGSDWPSKAVTCGAGEEGQRKGWLVRWVRVGSWWWQLVVERKGTSLHGVHALWRSQAWLHLPCRPHVSQHW